jgi:hypothetical protein
MRFMVEVITIGGGLPDFLGAFCSRSVFSASVVSVSVSVVLRVRRSYELILFLKAA